MADEPLRTSTDLIRQSQAERRAVREATARAEDLARRVASLPWDRTGTRETGGDAKPGAGSVAATVRP